MTEVRWPQAISILLDFIPCSSPRVLHSSFEPKTLRCASKYFPFVPSSLLHSNIAKMADNGSGHYLGSCLTWDHLDDYRGARQLPMLCYLDTSQRHSADADPEDVQYYGNNLPIWGSISSEVRLRYSSSSLTCEITSPPSWNHGTANFVLCSLDTHWAFPTDSGPRCEHRPDTAHGLDIVVIRSAPAGFRKRSLAPPRPYLQIRDHARKGGTCIAAML